MKRIDRAQLVVVGAGLLLALGGSDRLGATSTSSVNAVATATMVTSLSISRTAHLNFGRTTVSSSAYTVTVSTSGTRTASDSSQLSAGTTPTAAAFSLTGQASTGYRITLPSSISLSDGAGHSMTVNAFTSNPATTGTLSVGGAGTITVGATLNVGASQTRGTYTNSGGVVVTVAYD